MLEDYKNHARSVYADQTLNRYERDVKAFLEVHNPLTVTYNDIQVYFSHMVNVLSKGSVNATKAALISFFDFLVNNNKRVDNPVKLLKTQTSNRRIDHDLLLDTNELDVLLQEREERYEVLKWRNKFIVSLIRYQALNNADLLNLKISDINEDEIQIKGRKGLFKRSLKLNAKQMLYWLKYEAVREKTLKETTDQLFINKLGQAMTGDGITSIVDTLKPLFPYKKINLKVLRASVIAEKLKESKDVIVTQKFAGHKWSSTTALYSNPITEELRLEVENLHPFKKM